MSTRYTVEIKDRHDGGKAVNAHVVRDVDLPTIRIAQGEWSIWLGRAEMDAENRHGLHVPHDIKNAHLHWNWEAKAIHAQASIGLLMEFMGVELDGTMQGLMWLQKQEAGSAMLMPGKAQGQPTSYIHYLAVAHWNAREVVVNPRYSRVGSILLRAAILVSKQEGHKGAIALHSHPQADSWYSAKCGMTDHGPDPAYDDLHYFTMSPNQAKAFLV